MYTRRHILASGIAAIVLAGSDRVVAGGEDATPAGEEYDPQIDPARFSATIDNPYMPLKPGTTFTFEGISGETAQSNTVTVTADTRDVMGVTCVVVRDQVFEGDTLLEDTLDWFAQDSDGNIWYFGEDSKSYEDGQMSTEGSWEAGVDGARPGIVMKAEPVVGDVYQQEYFPGEAEDMAEVVRTGESVTVPFGTFDDVLVTKEWTPLEPDIVEEKYYAPGIGVVLTDAVQGETERFELVDIQTGGATPEALASPAG